MIKIFLGGTVAGYDWRKIIEKEFKCYRNVELFNPIVSKWTKECVIRENEYKENCDISLFVITPYMEGIYSIAEAVEESNKRPEGTVFVILDKVVNNKEIRTFTEHMKHSLQVTGELIERNGGKYFTSLDEVIDYIRYFINK